VAKKKKPLNYGIMPVRPLGIGAGPGRQAQSTESVQTAAI